MLHADSMFKDECCPLYIPCPVTPVNASKVGQVRQRRRRINRANSAQFTYQSFSRFLIVKLDPRRSIFFPRFFYAAFLRVALIRSYHVRTIVAINFWVKVDGGRIFESFRFWKIENGHFFAELSKENFVFGREVDY